MIKRKFLKAIISSVLSVCLLASVATAANAASTSTSGSLNGTPTYASLGMSDAYASATTSSGFSAAGHMASVSFTYWHYVNGVRVLDTSSGYGTDTSTAYAFAYSEPLNPSAKSASSSHTVTYDGQTWSTTLHL